MHANIWGPISVPSIQGHKYFLTLVDDHTRHTWIYLLKLKSEATNYLQQFINMIHTQHNVLIKKIKTDNGSEFQMNDFFPSKGIIHQKSYVKTPQQTPLLRGNFNIL